MKLVSVITACVTLWLFAAPVFAQNTTLHVLTVRRDQNVFAFNFEFDAAFNSAGEVAVTDDGVNDISCTHSFFRDGDVTVFPDPAGSDCTNVDQTEVGPCLGQPGFIKVVTSINFCGQMGNFAGCANRPGNTMLLQRAAFTGPANGVLVDHEFGHATGLFHRNTPPLLIMNQTLGVNNRRLNAAECTSLQSDNIDEDGPPAGQGGASVGGPGGASVGGDILTAESVDYSKIPIEDLAHTIITDSMPMDAADYYTQDDVETLIGMLKDPSEDEGYKVTIASLVGIISDGSDDHAQALIEYDLDEDLEEGVGAPVALGYLANRGSSKALEFLLKRADDKDPDVSELAIVGLQLSGSDQAREKLVELRDRSSGKQAEALDVAVLEFEKIESQGLRAYYGR